jgi:ABC-2 type transport system permease protein
MIRRALIVMGKEFRHMMHDRLTLAFTFFLPAVQLILYGYAFDARVRNLPAAVINRDMHEPGRLLAERFANSPLLAVTTMDGTDAQIESALRRGSVRAAIEIPRDYSSNMLLRKPTVLRVWLDGSDVLTASYVLAGIETIGGEVSVMPVAEIQSNILFNAEGRTASYLIPGLVAILLQLVITLLMALSLTSERERGTLEQLVTSPLGIDAIIAGKCAAIACVGVVESASLMLLMRWLFSITIHGSVFLLVAVVPLLVLAPMGFGLLIAARAKNQMQAIQMTQVVFLPAVMMSGFIWPREFLAYPINLAGSLLPATYLVALMRAIVLRGSGLAETAQYIAIATLFGVGLTVAGWWAMRRSLQA